MPSNVKCADCGFLALRRMQSREIAEAEDGVRSGGGLPSHGNFYLYDEHPLCFVKSINFRELIGPGGDISGRRKAMIAEERQCDGFTPWQQGFTPKEHAEMIQEEARLRWQAEREDADRVWREDQEEKADSHHKDNIRIAQASERSNYNSQIYAGLIGAFAALIATAIGAWLNKPPQISVQPSSVIVQPSGPSPAANNVAD